MKSKSDSLQILILDLSNKLFKEAGRVLTIQNDYIHISQEKRADVNKGFIHERPINALEMIRDQKFDSVISFYQAMGLKSTTWLRDKPKINVTAPENWVVLYKALTLLSGEGSAIFLAEPRLWSSKKGQEFLKDLEENNYFLNALFELPPNSIELTALRPYLYVFTRKKNQKLFIAELTDESNLSTITDNYLKNHSADNLFEGVFVNRNKFKNFQSYKVAKEFSILTKHYKTFKLVSIKNIVTEIKTKEFDEDDNSIYLRMAGNFKSVKFNEITKNKYIQLKLNTKEVNPEYLHHFLNTEIGQKFLNSFSNGSYIPFLSTEDLLNAEIYLLPFDLQKKTIKTIAKINDIVDNLHSFESKLLHDPLKASSVSNELESLMQSLTSISKEEQFLSRIRKGEDLHTEFKSSLQWDIKLKKISKDRQHDILRTLCGFLNTDGGTLFVGVEDDGNLLGIDDHTFPSVDKYLLRVRSLIKDNLGANYYPFIDYKIFTILDKNILVMDIKKCNHPVYLGKDGLFYVRTNPSTDELKGREFVEYINNHFGKK